ncbi:hypothetical protein JXR93_13260 [bacterium]|nr:hypothetical protein [bacterium]
MSKNSALSSILDDFWYEQLSETIMKNKDWERYLGENRELTFPKRELTFVALNDIKPEDVKVVVFGQDPYPREESAVGHAFWDGKVKSWNDALSPSIRNIFKSVLVSKNLIQPSDKIAKVREVVKKNGIMGPDRFFQNSIEQGVLWLNASLTFTSKDLKELDRHLTFWRPIIEKIIETLLNKSESLVFIFWGGKAKVFQSFINKTPKTAKIEFVENCHPMLDTFQDKNSFTDIEEAQKKLNQKIISWI